MNQVRSDNKILLEVNEGCVSCPFSRDCGCGCDPDVNSTHDYTYPAKCPLLDKTVEVRRV